MARKGRFLEILMRDVQKFLADDEIEIKSPEEFYENGLKIGEIDITIRCEVGISKLYIGIECRDRKSKNKQGIEWINELVGKKDLFKLDKIIAVSKYGFTEPAIARAISKSIDVISFAGREELADDSWIQRKSICMASSTKNINCDGKVDIKLSGQKTLAPSPSIDNNIKDRIFRRKDDKKYLSILQLIQSYIEKNGFVEGKRQDVIIDEKIKMMYMMSEHDVSRIIINDVIVVDTVEEQPVDFVMNAVQDHSTNKTIALTGSCKLKMNNKETKVVAIIKKTKNGKESIRLSLFDKNDNQINFPDSGTLSLYRRKK